MAKKRNPSFEILRVVAMFLIVVWHFLMHGVGQKPDGITSDIPSLFNLCSMEMIGCLAKVSTKCYILITGYFIIHQTSPKWEKIPKTWAPIVFYSVLLFFVFLLCSNLRLGWDDFGKSLMPIYFNRYWFATRYVALVALAPFLAIVTQALTRRQYLVMLGVMAVINFDFLLGDQMSGNNSLLWFVFLFYVGGYIRLHFNHEGVNHFGKLYFLVAIVLAAIFLVKTFVHYGVWSSPMMADYHDNNGILFIALSGARHVAGALPGAHSAVDVWRVSYPRQHLRAPPVVAQLARCAFMASLMGVCAYACGVDGGHFLCLYRHRFRARPSVPPAACERPY